MTTTGNAVTFINNTNKKLFLGFSDLMKRMGVALPPQLLTSPHLALQKEQRERRTEGPSKVGGEVKPSLLTKGGLHRKRGAEKSSQPPTKKTKNVGRW
jgi:hypothetical protein